MHAEPTPAWPSLVRRYLVLAGLTGFAISQPLLSVLGDDPVTLAYHGVDGVELVLLGALIAVVPPLVLCSLQAVVAWRSARAGRAVHLVTSAALAALFTIQLVKEIGLDQRLVIVVLAMAAGATFAVLHVRHDMVALWASYTAILPVLAAVFFVAMSPASALLSASQDAPDRINPSNAADVPVVVVFLDELPTRSLMTSDGAIDATRFPNLSRFSEDATWYRHHTAMATHTVASVPSMLSGTTPSDDPPLWTNYSDTLFTLLAPTHGLEVVESATSLCPYTSCTPTRVTEAGTEEDIEVAGPGFSDMLRLTRDVWTERVTPGPEARSTLDDFAEQTAVTEPPPPDLSTQSEPVDPGEGVDLGDARAVLATSERADQLTRSFDATKGATLYFLHLMLPHQPFVREPDGELYGAADPFNLGVAPGDQPYSWSEWTGAVSEQRHLLQAQYTDRLIGQMMDELRAEGMYDDALVVVTADHGISFETDTPSRIATPDTVDAIGYTPLLIKRPGQDRGAIDDTNVMGVDLVPTIADILGLPIDWEVAGAPVGSPAIADRGGAKVMYVLEGFSKVTIKEVIEYDDADAFPTVGQRWIGPLRDRDDPLSGLNARLDLDGVLGADLDAVRTGSTDLTAQTYLLGDLRAPSGDGAPLGLVTGFVRDVPDDARLVLALDDVIVGGSRFSTNADGGEGHFAVLLPQAVVGGEHTVRAAIVAGGEVLEIAMEEF